MTATRGTSCLILQEEVLHDVIVIDATSIWQKTSAKHNNGRLTIVALVTTV
jgi:hypothetical protein